MKSTLRLFRTDLLQRLPFRIQSFGHFAMLTAMIVFSMGCQKDEVVVETSSGQTHVAFAGGGWRAHTGHSGWNIALLDSGKRTLDDVYENVGTISSNSGGSWFSTMLMYSSSFDSAIQVSDAVDSWGTTGWLGQQDTLFNRVTACDSLRGDSFAACVANYYSSSFTDPLGALHWRKVVYDLVFKHYHISAKLEDSPNSWASEKSLLLAASLLTSNVVLNRNWDQDNNYYQACISPNTTILNGKSLSYCSGKDSSIVSPVTFSRIPSGSEIQPPPFLSAIKTGTSASHFNLGYTDDTWRQKDTVARYTRLQNPLSTDQVQVMDAAAASSAAVGFGASATVSGSFDTAYGLEDEAISFQLSGSNVQYSDPEDLGVEGLADSMMVRIADGGPVDNSGVAQLVSFLQLNNQADGFNILAFDNVQQPHTPSGGKGADVGTDIAYLFGEGLCTGNQFCSELGCGGTCITVPDLQIFEKSSLVNTAKTWGKSPADSTSSSGIYELIYTKYTVNTVDNPTYGISANSTGTLHAFTCVWANAPTAPTSDNFSGYNEMLSFINSGLQADSAKGLKYLQAAMGMSD